MREISFMNFKSVRKIILFILLCILFFNSTSAQGLTVNLNPPSVMSRGSSYTVPIMVANFNNVNVFQFEFLFNKDNIDLAVTNQYTSYNGIQIASNTANGRMIIMWVSASPSGTLNFGSGELLDLNIFVHSDARIGLDTIRFSQCLVTDIYSTSLNPQYYNSDIDITSIPLYVEITSLIGTAQGINSAILKWSTATEVNNNGFEVERRGGTSAWAKVGSVAGAGTSNSPKDYTFVDTKVAPGMYVYRLKQIDNDGSFKYSSSVEVNVGATGKVLELKNYPNPFNPTSEVIFAVPEDGYASLKVYNMLGQEIATLYSGMAKAGHYVPLTFNASRLASGIYFSRLEFNGKSVVQRMLLTK